MSSLHRNTLVAVPLAAACGLGVALLVSNSPSTQGDVAEVQLPGAASAVRATTGVAPVRVLAPARVVASLFDDGALPTGVRTLDVLSRSGDLTLAGTAQSGKRCVVVYRELATTGPFTQDCGYPRTIDRLVGSRHYGTHSLTVLAPSASTRLTITGADGTKDVKVHQVGGPAWDMAAFATSWPDSGAATVVSYDAAGHELGRSTVGSVELPPSS